MSDMEIKPMPGTTKNQRTRGFFASCSHQYDSFTRGCNWRDFTLLHLEAEWSEMTGEVSVALALLGLHVTLRYVYDDAFRREMMARREDALAHPERYDVMGQPR